MKKVILAMTLLGAFPLSAAAVTTSFSFELTGPNLASDPSSGDTIRMTGAGSFNTAAGTVLAEGSYKILQPDGTVVQSGTWEATGFTSFTSFGGPHPGFQGGVLSITVTLMPVRGTPLTGQAMTVTCAVNAPTGFEEGITIGDFTMKSGSGHPGASGTTLFHGHN